MKTVHAAVAAFKKCSACGETKSSSDFCKHRRHPDGLNSHCRVCKSARARAKYANDPATRAKVKVAREAWTAAHTDWSVDYARKYYEAHKATMNAQARAAHRLHRDERLAYHVDYYVKNKKAHAARGKAYAKAKPEVIRACARRRYQRKIAQRHPSDKMGQRRIRERLSVFSGRCVYCGCRATATDHRIALSEGGPHILANIVPACKRCNSRKRTRRAAAPFLHAEKLPLPG